MINISDACKRDGMLRLVSWNVNSWTDNNCDLRQKVLNYLVADVIVIVETKLKHDDIIKLHGYQWFGSNRKSQLRSARCGSGGIGFFQSYQLLESWEVTNIDASIDGLYIIGLDSKNCDCQLILCACYLSPETSTWGREVDVYFNHFTSVIQSLHQ